MAHPGLRVQVPALWLFQPNGVLWQQIIDEARLRATLADFHVLPPVDAGQAGLRLEQLGRLLGQRDAPSRSGLVRCEGRWTALVLAEAGDCDRACARFERAVEELQASYPGHLCAIHLLLD